ncbi:MAG: triose-phosphate isomerase [Candidatus Cloacimonetes bacterium]|jgi:triosephosphate isomerase|nr:triose-phosphate isomerase [Candidatus Cloacimonadota bacterium]
MRKIIIAGNWKMNKDASETSKFCSELGTYLKKHDNERVLPLIAPVFPFLSQAQGILRSLPVAVAAQDVSSHAEGAFTGEVSAAQLCSLEVRHCIIGHSERRQYHGETDALIREKLLRLLENGIIPIVCIGETLQQREQGRTEQVIISQLEGCFDQITIAAGDQIVIAYEPVWAIGTGKTATSGQAQEVHALIRNWLQTSYGSQAAADIHILYGGSVKPDNIRELLEQKDIDGGLIGGASLKIDSFCTMIGLACELSSAGGN